jgi:sodium transport system permease protein
MIRLPISWRIFRREILDAFRNWNVIFVTILLPFATAPLTGIALTEITSQQAASEARESDVGSLKKDKSATGKHYKVAVLGNGAEAFEQKIGERNRFEVTALDIPLGDTNLGDLTAKDPPPEAAAIREKIRDRIITGDLDAVLVAQENAPDEKNLTNVRLVLFADETLPSSKKASTALERVAEEWRKDFRKDRLEEIGQTENALRPFQFDTEQLAPRAKRMAYLMAPMLAVFLFLVLASGCYYSASYSIAGEKERGTLATLLAAPIRPVELLMGKWLNVTCIGFIGALANTCSLVVTGVLMMRAAAKHVPGASLFGDAEFSLATLAPSGGLLLLNLMLLGMMLASLTLVICMFARGQNDATYLLTPFILFVCLPAVIAVLPNVEWQTATAAVPLLNNALLIRCIVRHEVLGAGLVFMSFAINIVFCLAVLAFGARMFESERVRFSESPGSLKDILSRRATVPHTGMVSALVIVLLLIGNFYLNLLFPSAGFATQVLAVQAWTVLVPLALVWFLKLPWRDVLSWRLPRPAVWPGAILMGATAWTIAVPFLKFFPVPEEWSRQFSEPFIKLLAEPGGLAIALLLAAVLPAICEEIAFRGVVLSGLLRRFSPGVAIFLTSVCFGIAHYSVFRFLPTAILGAVLSWTTWRTKSIFPGMLMHAINNGLAIAAMAASAKDTSPSSLPSWPVLAGGGAIFLLGLFIVRTATRPEKEKAESPA